jgi:hypothetical protein
MWSAWQLLFGPGSERLTYLIIAPFAAWAMLTSFFERRNLWLATAAFITMFLLGSGNAERVLIRWTHTAVALEPMGVLLFAAWLLRHAYCHCPAKGELAKPRAAVMIAQNDGRSAA